MEITMMEKISRNNRGLKLLGWVAGVLSLLFFIAFYYAGDEVGNYYYLGAFFTSLIITVLCLCFSQVYDVLGQIYNELKQRD